MATLLEQAKAIPRNRKFPVKGLDKDIAELAIAWMKDEVTITQVSTVLKMKSNSHALNRMGYLLREAYRMGMIQVSGDV